MKDMGTSSAICWVFRTLDRKKGKAMLQQITCVGIFNYLNRI